MQKNMKLKTAILIYINSTSNKLKEVVEQIDSKISVKLGKFDKKSLLIKEIIKDHTILVGVDKYYELIHK